MKTPTKRKELYWKNKKDKMFYKHFKNDNSVKKNLKTFYSSLQDLRNKRRCKSCRIYISRVKQK